MNTTFIVVKPDIPPEGFLDFLYVLFYRLLGFKVHLCMVTLPRESVLSLYRYSNLSEALQNATVEHLADQPLWVLRVSGLHALKTVAAMRGSATDPSQCEPCSLRRTLADHYGVATIPLPDGQVYYRNFIHSPKDWREFSQCQLVLGKYFP